MDKNSLQIIKKLMFRLLPIQILLASVGAVNGIISSYFASNFVGVDAMSAVGLYAPVGNLIGAIGSVFAGGCAIVCGKYLGRNEHKKLQGVFSLDMLVCLAVGALFTAAMFFMGLFRSTAVFTNDEVITPILSRYLLGASIGIIPKMLSSQMPVYLQLENKGRRILTATIVYIFVNLALDFLFIQVMGLQELGIALAESLGMWVFFGVEAQCFFSGTHLKFRFTDIPWKETGRIILIGFPGAAGYIYLTARGIIVNRLLEAFVGTVGISAFATANNLMGLVWAVPTGMLAVSRLLISVSAGEEDRKTLTNVIRVAMRYYMPVLLAVDLAVIGLAMPLTRLFYSDASQPVFTMMVWGLRMLPLCMPFSLVQMHFVCYGQTSGKQVYVNILALLDGLVGVAGFSLLLIPVMGIKGVYLANILNGVVSVLFIIGYAWFRNKHLSLRIPDLMVIPEDFGVADDEKIDISVQTPEEVVSVSRSIQEFCQSKGIDEKRSYYAALAMEEMAGNIVEHGFEKDSRQHSVDVRVVHKDDVFLLRIKDDCIPFDPKERSSLTEGDDALKNIGIRLIYGIMKDIDYQNVLGLNVLTIKI